MSGIIRSERAGERVRAVLKAAPPPLQVPIDPEIDPELAHARAELAQLSDLLRDRQAEIDNLKQAIEEAWHDGEAQGRKAGFLEGSQYAEKAIAALTKGVSQACESLASDVENLERLALLVAEEALQRVLGPEADQKTLIAQIVVRQIEQLGAQAVLIVEVSGEDFAPPHLVEMRERHPSIEFRTADEVARGGCRMKLRLGSLEVGPHQQWGAIKAELSKMAASTVP
jgi:flagellar biosynthesis/type III secretory pathway protein FliH